MPEYVTLTRLTDERTKTVKERPERILAQADLEPWAAFLQEPSRRGRHGYAFFNNDARGSAPRDAKTLIGLLGEAAVPW